MGSARRGAGGGGGAAGRRQRRPGSRNLFVLGGQMPPIWADAVALSPEQADQLEKEGVQQAEAVLDEEEEGREQQEEDDNGDDPEPVRARRLPTRTRTTPATDRRGRRGRGGRGRGGRRRGPGFGNVEQAEELTNDPELATGAATGQYIHVPPEQRMLTVDLAGMMERMRLASGVPEGVLAGENRNSFAAGYAQQIKHVSDHMREYRILQTRALPDMIESHRRMALCGPRLCIWGVGYYQYITIFCCRY